MNSLSRWILAVVAAVLSSLGCSGEQAQDVGGEAADPDSRLVRVDFSFEADGAAEAASALARLSKDTAPAEFSQALAELHRRVGDGAARIGPELARFCTRDVVVAQTMPLGSCVATKAGARRLSGARGINVYSTGPAEERLRAFSHAPGDEEFSHSFRDLTQTPLLDRITGAGVRIGVVEYSDCDAAGDPWRVDDSVAALRAADVHHLNTSRRDFGLEWPHMHLVTTAMTHFHERSRATDILPEASFYVANLALRGLTASSCDPGHKGSLLEAMDWFVAEDVRLVNRSTFTEQIYDRCDGPKDADERVLDLYARTYDIVVTTAAGQTPDEAEALCPTWCDAQNQTCVGAASDQNHRNVGDPDNRLDDLWVPFFEHDDGSREFYFFEDPEEQDREEPDVVAPATHVVTSIPQSRSMASLSGTSLGSPLVLSLLAKQLEIVSASGSQPWTACRVSEFMRAAVTFASGWHPVEVDRERVRTAAHDLMESDNRNGLVAGAECRSPDQCAIGLTCLFGVCAERPGDEKAGWGMASPLQSILDGEWGCFATGGTTDCGLSRDGTCLERTRPSDALDPREFGARRSPEPPPGKIGIAEVGYPLATPTLAEGDVYRGALAWSSCPVEPTFGTVSCASDADCPQFHTCSDAFGTCQQSFAARRTIPAVDFDVRVYEWRTGEGTWLSYSRDDVTEAFEFVAPRAGSYGFWAFPQDEDWDCDESEFGQTDEDGEFLVFIGGTIP